MSYGLTRLEANALSQIPLNNTTIKAIVRDRVERYNRFTVVASRKMSEGKWRPGDFWKKWLENLSRLYTKEGWRVQGKYQKNQVRRPVGSLNPWAMFRNYEKSYPDKRHVSPWEVKAVKNSNKGFDRGQIFVQRAAMGSSAGRIRGWIEQLNQTILSAPGGERARMIIQRRRLEAML
jgi:hypothetical protein